MHKAPKKTVYIPRTFGVKPQIIGDVVGYEVRVHKSLGGKRRLVYREQWAS